MELAAAGEGMKKLREIARVHIARCEAGDMQAIKELANRLDGRPAQILRVGEINRAVNLSIRATSDWSQYGVDDFWSAPLATLKRGSGGL